jgi:Sulfotransferase family
MKMSREVLPERAPTTAGDDPQALEEQVIGELRHARVSGRRAPDFFIVGHAKCGTTALYQMLKAHPQIHMSDVKEPEFLSRAPQHHARREELAKEPPKRLPRTLDAYLALFEETGPGQLAGEASTEYLRTPATARRIAELCPDARIIAMFREPVSFLRSLHLQLLQVGVETEPDFARAIGLEEQRSRGRRIPHACPWPPALLYSRHVRYVEQLREYHDHFGRERVLVALYDDFRTDNEGVIREVLRFLGVDDSPEIELAEANPTLRVRSHRGDRLVNSISVGTGPISRVVKTAIKAVTPQRLRRGALRAAIGIVIETKPTPPSPEFVLELRKRFRPEVLAMSEYLGRDLASMWGYDDVE